MHCTTQTTTKQKNKMDFPYTPNENDWHEKALLSELQELSLVHLTQPRWYKRHIFENAKTNKYSRNRRKAEKHAQKRFNVLGDIQDEQIHLEDDDDDDINLSDIDEAQMEKALGFTHFFYIYNINYIFGGRIYIYIN